jgi:hypothetical protein
LPHDVKKLAHNVVLQLLNWWLKVMIEPLRAGIRILTRGQPWLIQLSKLII